MAVYELSENDIANYLAQLFGRSLTYRCSLHVRLIARLSSRRPTLFLLAPVGIDLVEFPDRQIRSSSNSADDYTPTLEAVDKALFMAITR